jgi:hypothetical protein
MTDDRRADRHDLQLDIVLTVATAATCGLLVFAGVTLLTPFALPAAAVAGSITCVVVLFACFAVLGAGR